MTKDRPLTGKHVLVMMVAFFGVIIAVNVTMAMMAKGTWTGLVVKNSYVASQQFNASLERATAQRKRRWIDRLVYADGAAVLTLTDAAGSAVTLERATVQVGRPASEHADRSVELAQRDGSYQAELNLAPGIWAIRISAQTADGPWRRDARLLISDTGAGHWQ